MQHANCTLLRKVGAGKYDFYSQITEVGIDCLLHAFQAIPYILSLGAVVNTRNTDVYICVKVQIYQCYSEQ